VRRILHHVFIGDSGSIQHGLHMAPGVLVGPCPFRYQLPLTPSPLPASPTSESGWPCRSRLASGAWLGRMGDEKKIRVRTWAPGKSWSRVTA
jgi:hypothetical protein